MYEFIRINDVLIISSAFNRMIRDDLKYIDVKSLFKLLCLMVDKKKPMYACDFVNSKNNIFRIKAKRIFTFLKNIAHNTFINVMHVSREAGGMFDSHTKRYE
jgi:ribosome biogenesis protein Nip4